MAFITEIDGNRVVFKGCTLRCPDCPTPELQSFSREIMLDSARCTGCGRCLATCQRKALHLDGNEVTLDRERCVSCGRCVLVCKNKALFALGRNYGAADLVRRLVEEAVESGVTLTGEDLRRRQAEQTFDRRVVLSGGEVLALDEQYLQTLVKGLFDAGISVSIETCGFRDDDRLAKLSPYIETFTFRRQ